MNPDPKRPKNRTGRTDVPWTHEDAGQLDEDAIARFASPQESPDQFWTGLTGDQRSILDLVHDSVIVEDLQGRIRFWNKAAEKLYGYTAEQAEGQWHHTLLRTRLPEPIQRVRKKVFDHDKWEGELTQTTRRGRTVTIHSRWALQRDDQGHPQSILQVASDVTPHRRALQKVQAEWHRFASVLGMLPGYVVMKDADCNIKFANRKYYDLFGTPNDKPSWRLQVNRSREQEMGLIARTLEQQISQAWEESLRDGRTYHVSICPFVDTDATPVVLEMGIDITQRKEVERQIAQISEQQRRAIGKDLHESVGQKLTGLRFLFQALVDRVRDQLPDEASLADQAQQVLQEAIGQIRATARGLDPVGLEGDSIADVLDRLARETQQLHDVRISVDCDAELDLSPCQALQFYRIAQEAVSNATRHGKASHISLSILRRQDGIMLSIVDDGVGLGPQATAPDGFGLKIMRHRAAVMNASLQVQPGNTGGTTVSCFLPLGSDGERDGRKA
jgi:PAS domain S-box-containing protein